MLRRVERAVTSIAVAFMLATMLIVVTDVMMRYLFNSPFSWAYDLVGMYLMAGIFFLGLPDSYRSHAHVSVDILHHRFSPAVRHACQVLTCVCAIGVFAVIARTGWNRAYENFVAGDVLAGQIPWPTWISAAMVPLGAGLLLLRLVIDLVRHSASVATGRDLAPLPPLSGSESPEGSTFE